MEILLLTWPELEPERALELLDYSYPDQAVRRFAVQCLEKMRCAFSNDLGYDKINGYDTLYMLNRVISFVGILSVSYVSITYTLGSHNQKKKKKQRLVC